MLSRNPQTRCFKWNGKKIRTIQIFMAPLEIHILAIRWPVQIPRILKTYPWYVTLLFSYFSKEFQQYSCHFFYHALYENRMLVKERMKKNRLQHRTWNRWWEKQVTMKMTWRKGRCQYVSLIIIIQRFCLAAIDDALKSRGGENDVEQSNRPNKHLKSRPLHSFAPTTWHSRYRGCAKIKLEFPQDDETMLLQLLEIQDSRMSNSNLNAPPPTRSRNSWASLCRYQPGTSRGTINSIIGWFVQLVLLTNVASYYH